MHVVVTGIDSTDRPAVYIANITINGSAREFRLEARLPRLTSVGYERPFEEAFRGTGYAGRIASLIVRFHKGEPIDFPVDVSAQLDS